MAEGALSGLASNLLTKIASTAASNKAFEFAKEDLDKVEQSIQNVQDVLIDAEKRRDSLSNIVVRNWIERVRNVLYEADDVFDEVSIDAVPKQKQKQKQKQQQQQHQMKEDKLLTKVQADKLLTKVQAFYHKIKVRASVSKSTPIITMKVKDIRQKFDAISYSKDTIRYNISVYPYDFISGLRGRVQRPGSFVDERDVIGRDDEKKAILEFLFNKPDVGPSVIAIVGIVGVGKTTLAQLVYNSEEVQKNYNKRWVCMSRPGFSMRELLDYIFKSMRRAENFLLVLDDVLDSTTSLYFEIIPVLRMGAVGSKIIVTTRSLSIAKDTMRADQIYQLNGLRKEESWQLFKKLTFQPELENDPRWISLGREIVERCDNVPLSIKSVASYLRIHATMQEWVSFKNEKVLFDDCILSTPRISYDSLLPILKQCFAYCSLFPKAYAFGKEELIYLWIAQGYLNSSSDDEALETTGHRYFWELLNGSLVQEAKVHECEESLSYSMHDLIHHLAVNVARDESTILTKGLCLFHRNIRHVSVGYAIDNSWSVPLSLVDAGRIRSFLFLYEGSLSPLALDKLLTKFRFLCALNLGHQKIGVVPSSIRELKYLRCLNLSHNKFMYLPDSIIKLVSLLTLDISWCEQLELLPDEFWKLQCLRHLDTRGCYRLRHMPPGFEELTSLQRLSYFIAGKAVDARSSSFDALARLELNGELEIMFDGNIDDVDEEECWELPRNISVLNIKSYPGMRIPYLKTTVDPILPYLVRLYVGPSSTLKHLSPFRCLPRLKTLHLSNLFELEYIDENESIQSAETITSDTVFFPSLKSLTLERLPKLKGWSTEVEGELHSLHLLSKLTVRCCQELKSMPLCPHLQTLELNDINEKLVQLLLSPNFYSPSSFLATITIWDCDLLKTFPGETLESLKHLELRFCDNLKNLYLAPTESNVLEQLVIQRCPELDLWGKKWGVDWDSLPNLNKLTVIGMPNPHKLPDCLQQSHAQGKLLIDTETQNKKYKIPGLTPGGDIGIRTKGNPKIKVFTDWISDSSRIKAESPSYAGLPSKNGSSDEKDLDQSGGSGSVPPTPRSEGEILKSSNLKSFSFSDLKMATRNFSPDCVLGEGGFEPVFKGWIEENTYAATGTGLVIAVKKLNLESFQGHREWLAEVNYLGQIYHPNLVKLIGYCLEDEHRLLVYEFMPRGSLENHLFRRSSYFQPLSWNLRLKVALGAAKGLAFLHSADVKVIYRDFKTSNVLLDSNYNAKLSDFGLAKDGPPGDKSHVSTIAIGTYGYAAPEYVATGHLTSKSNVYSFGVVLLELLSGRRAVDKNWPSGEHNLIEWARPYLTNKRKICRILDNRLEGQYSLDAAHRAATLALRCLSAETKLRPAMAEVTRELEKLQDYKGRDSVKEKKYRGCSC